MANCFTMIPAINIVAMIFLIQIGNSVPYVSFFSSGFLQIHFSLVEFIQTHFVSAKIVPTEANFQDANPNSDMKVELTFNEEDPENYRNHDDGRHSVQGDSELLFTNKNIEPGGSLFDVVDVSNNNGFISSNVVQSRFKPLLASALSPPKRDKKFWKLCNPSQSYTAQIKKFDLGSGSTIHRGKPTEIILEGLLKEQVEEGAFAEVTILYKHIQLLHATFDVCQELEAIANRNELKCPIPKGPIQVKDKIDIPSELPMGIYDIEVKGFSKSKKEMICVKMRLEVV